MLISKTAIVKWHGKTRKHYESLGYKFTKIGDEFEVDVNHLTNGSHAIVTWSCDGENCNEIIIGEYHTYLRFVKEDGKIYCNKCATKLFSVKKSIQTRIKNGKSFEEKCIEINRLDILARWDEELNKCKPSEVTYSSCIPRWFKCDKHPEHHSELKRLNDFVNGQEGSIECNQCKSVAQNIIDLYGDLYKIWNKELNGDLNPWEISYGSGIEVWWNCPDGNHEPFLRSCAYSKIYKYRCPECYDNNGENNPNYNPNLTDKDREKRRYINGYKYFIKDVMSRDDYTCQVTGKRGGNLVVHHLNGYHWDKENRTNPDNGIVLCEEIHNLFHSIYGYKNNTKEQFEEFLMRIESEEIDISNIK